MFAMFLGILYMMVFKLLNSMRRVSLIGYQGSDRSADEIFGDNFR